MKVSEFEASWSRPETVKDIIMLNRQIGSGSGSALVSSSPSADSSYRLLLESHL